jgi:hypothetical protein
MTPAEAEYRAWIGFALGGVMLVVAIGQYLTGRVLTKRAGFPAIARRTEEPGWFWFSIGIWASAGAAIICFSAETFLSP